MAPRVRASPVVMGLLAQSGGFVGGGETRWADQREAFLFVLEFVGFGGTMWTNTMRPIVHVFLCG